MTPVFIKTTQDLKDILDQHHDEKVIFLDTEFKRETTFYPIACLIQFCFSEPETIYLIDPIIGDINLDPFIDFLKKTSLLKVLHSARQDIEIFYHHYKFMPYPVWDTQIMASYIGQGYQMSFDALLKKLLDVTIDKSQQRTDWEKRPFTEEQIQYAANDVYYLAPLYHKLHSVLKQQGRLEWLKEEMESLADEEQYKINPDAVFKKVKHSLKTPQDISVLYALAQWRENQAAQKDRVRQRILDDSHLSLLASKKPISIEKLKDIKKIPLKKIYQYGDELIKVIQESMHTPYQIKKPFVKLSLEQKNLYDFLGLYIKIASDKYNLSPNIMASSSDLKSYVSEQKALFTQGWRYELFGKELEEIASGKKSIGYVNEKLQIL